MNAISMNAELIRNRYYEYFARSPELFLFRLQHLVQRKTGVRLPISKRRVADAVTWAREDVTMSTRLYLFNYLTEHYQLDRVELALRVRDRGGRVIGEDRIGLEPRETRIIEVKETLARMGHRGDFVGAFHFERLTPGPASENPFRVLQEFYCDNCQSAVHDYGTADNFFYDDLQTAVTVSPEPEVQDVQVGLSNTCLDGGSRFDSVSLILTDSQGKARTVYEGHLPGGASALYSLNQLYPDWRAFLVGRYGNIAVKSQRSLGRPLVFHLYEGKRSFGGNHMTGDKSRLPYVCDDAMLASTGLGPVWTSGILFGQGISSRVTLLNNFAFNRDYEVGFDVFGQDGTRRAQFSRRIGKGATHCEDLAPHFKPEARAGFEAGTVRVHLKKEPNLPYLPAAFDANIEIVGKGWRQPVSTSSVFLNVPPNADIRTRQIQKSRSFIRGRSTAKEETYVLLANQSSMPGHATASDTEIRFISRDGKREVRTTRTIPPFGALFASMSELFPDLDSLRENGETVGTLHFRDPKLKLMPLHLTLYRSSGVFSGDHWLGG